MNKTTLSLITALAAAGSSMGATYYSTNEPWIDTDNNDKLTDATSPHASSGKAWDTNKDWERDPTKPGNEQETNGNSETYTGGHDLVIQAGHRMRVHQNADNTTTEWNAASITLAGEFHTGHKVNANTTFNSTINVQGSEAKWLIGNHSSRVYGSGKLNVSGDSKLLIKSSSSKSTGSLQMDLEIVGNGTIAFDYAADTLGTIGFGNVSSAFTGVFDARFANDVTLSFGGSDTYNSSLILGRGEGDKLVKLDMSQDVAFKEVTIEGVDIAAGSHTRDELIAIGAENGKDWSKNLTDGDGKLHVGVMIPEPSTVGLLGLGGLALLLRRRRSTD